MEILFDRGKITYLYTATGEKINKVVTQGGGGFTVNYLDGFQYFMGKLLFFPTAEGYFNAETQNYVYQYRDHLGNVRLSYSDANRNDKIDVGEIIEETNYYPFGLAHQGYNEKNNTIAQKYKYQYNGKEKQDELGLNLYDYGARNYDAAIGRWMNVDPLAEQFPAWNPYHYVHNNPINLVDPTGMSAQNPGGGKVIAVFYHGGPTGGGKQTTVSNAGYTGQIYSNTQSAASNSGRGFSGTIIAPGLTSASGVKTGYDFINQNYQEGDQVIIYGYSYGVDVAVDLTHNLNESGIGVNLLVTVDGSDGPFQNMTVNTTIPKNVETNLNIYQTNNSGASSSSRSTGSSSGATSSSSGSNSSGSSNRSNSGSSNSPGSKGGPNKAVNSNSTNILNKKIIGSDVNHGNIQQKSENIIQPLINSTIDQR
ncbi:RHS repeat-associated core domain-containing protein [Myroides sp. DW712]|uniref:RHS repeat-associated core domain-containing protein n=1 Tax=Myroides sp. DW712 TaxID=3389800 RepID=UPI00397A5018